MHNTIPNTMANQNYGIPKLIVVGLRPSPNYSSDSDGQAVLRGKKESSRSLVTWDFAAFSRGLSILLTHCLAERHIGSTVVEYDR